MDNQFKFMVILVSSILVGLLIIIIQIELNRRYRKNDFKFQIEAIKLIRDSIVSNSEIICGKIDTLIHKNEALKSSISESVNNQVTTFSNGIKDLDLNIKSYSDFSIKNRSESISSLVSTIITSNTDSHKELLHETIKLNQAIIDLKNSLEHSVKF